MESQSETTQTVFALKLPVLKTREYELWSMRMEQYLTFTNHALWEVIVNDDFVTAVASASAEDEHLLKFHACKDEKSLWEAIKNRFQKLTSQLKIHGEVISQEDANLKLLRSLPSAWNNIALIMRNKSDLDTLSMDDLYNNLKVYESEIKGQSSSSLNSHNVAFVFSDNTSSTNETVNTAHNVSAASSKDQASTASYADDMNLKWQVTMLTIRVKRFIQKIKRKLYLNGKETVGFDRTKVECYNCHRKDHFFREYRAPRNQGNRNRDAPTRNAPVNTSTINALVVQDGIGGYDWSFQAKEELTNFALMAHTSSSSSSDPKDQRNFDSGCFRHTIGNKSYLTDYHEIDGGFVAFGGNAKGGKITRKGKIKTGKLDFEDVYFVKELKFNFFSVLQMCDKKNSVLFTDTQCVVLSLDFKLLDESQVLLKVPRNNNMYIFDLKNVVPIRGYSIHNKAFRVFNTITKIIEENLHITLLENKPNIAGIGPNWMFDIDTLTMSMNYQPVFAGNQTNGPKSSEDEVVDDAGKQSSIDGFVDGKKNIVTEASIRRDLQLQDVKGTACLPNDTIFKELARMGYDKITQKLTFYKAFFSPQWKFLIHTILQCLSAKTTAWNEFSSTMASAIICLANNQKFNFSKYIFDNMVKNLEAGDKFYMFLRFVQVFVNHQLGDMSHHKKIFVTLSLTKKVFANMEREGKGFSGIITHLFVTMMVQAPEEVGEEITLVDETQKRMNEEEMFGVNDLDGDEVIVDATTGEEVEHSIKVAEKEVSTADTVTTAGEVVTTAEDVEVTTAATTPQISKDELTLAQTLIEIKAAKPKARGVIVQEPSEFRTTSSSQPSQLPQAKDKGKAIMVELEKPLKKKDQIAFDEERNIPPTKAQQRNLMYTYLKDIDGWKPKSLKKKSLDEIQKLFDSVMKRVNTFVDMNTEIVEERSKKTQAEVTECSSKRAGDELEQESAKRQKLEKEDDSAKLKRCLEIVPEDDDDDVTIEATPLSSK
nr:ribonuclease H-like domain-containing protein [Tanacetum cinerariifolium]